MGACCSAEQRSRRQQKKERGGAEPEPEPEPEPAAVRRSASAVFDVHPAKRQDPEAAKQLVAGYCKMAFKRDLSERQLDAVAEYCCEQNPPIQTRADPRITDAFEIVDNLPDADRDSGPGVQPSEPDEHSAQLQLTTSEETRISRISKHLITLEMRQSVADRHAAELVGQGYDTVELVQSLSEEKLTQAGFTAGDAAKVLRSGIGFIQQGIHALSFPGASPRLEEGDPPLSAVHGAESPKPDFRRALSVEHPEPEPDASDDAASHSFKSCLDRPYVRKEILWAQEHEKNIITLWESESHRPGYFDYDLAWKKYIGTELEFLLRISAIKYQRDEFLTKAMLANIFAKASTEDIEAATSPINEPGKWDFFLSHNQKYGGDQMKTLSLLFEQEGKSSWYDNGKLDKSEKAMEEGVKHSKNFVLLLTADAPS